MNKFLAILFLCGLYLCNSCKTDDNVIPNVYVDLTLHLNDPSLVNLNSIGGWVYLQGGVRGIIVYKRNVDEYVAFDRNCTYQPSNSCSTIKMESSNITAIDTCCGSRFQIYDGVVLKGPATRALKRYQTSTDGTVLHVYNY